MSSRRLLIIAIVLNVVLAAALFWMWRRSHREAEKSVSIEHPPMEGFTPATSETANEQPLVPIQLSAERIQRIGVKTVKAENTYFRADIRATGTIEVNERRVAYVQTRYPGWIRDVYVNATYQYVKKGEPLFTIYSPELAATEQEYLLARNNLTKLRQSSLSEVSSGAEQLLQAARERLKQWNVSDSDIARLDASGKASTEFIFTSPVSGYVLERMALPNAYVQPEMKLYTVADLSMVWAYGQVFQEDAGKLKPNDPAEISVDAYPDRIFSGRIEQILPQVESATRTLRVRIALPNPGLLLKPGMFVNVQLRGPATRQLVVPASAILHSGTRDVAFIARGSGVFEPRNVEIGLRSNDKVAIRKGLAAGDVVVTSANFLIDSESQLQTAAAAFTPGASQTPATQTPTSEAGAELTTNPSPAEKGTNEVRIRITGPNGEPVAGAEVSVRFHMPAMPAMGMSEMNATADLQDQGSGFYRGKIELGSGGTWQVTITAQRNGKILVIKRLNVSATGGM
jgi:RND family efflux transporter MFP subunit